MEAERPRLSVDDVLSKAGFGRFQIVLFLLGAVFKATESIELFIVSIISPILTCVWRLSPTDGGYLTAGVFIGMIVGGVVWGSASDLYGRRKILILTSILVVIYGCLSSRSPTFSWLFTLRLILAFFLNGVLLTTMSYVLEFNPVAYRGKVIACLCLCWPVGGILMAAVSYLSMKIFSWRAMLLTNSLPLLIPIIFVWFFPSSPHFLLTMGKKEEARRVLDFIITTNRVKRFDYDLIAPEMKTRTQFKELFNKKFGTTIAYLSILFFGQGIVYIGHVLIIVLLPLHPHTCLSTSGLHFYVPDLLVDDSCCQPPSDATFITIVVSSIGEIGSVIITYPLIDRVGRRKTLIVSGFLASGSFLLLAICSGNILINIFFAITRVTVSAFTITLLVYTLEVFPTSVRNLGVGFCEITSFSGSIVTSFVAEIFVPKGNGLSVVLFYAAVLFAMSSISCLLPYETAAKPLKDIADEPEYELSEYDQQSRNILQTAESHSMETKVYGTQ